MTQLFTHDAQLARLRGALWHVENTYAQNPAIMDTLFTHLANGVGYFLHRYTDENNINRYLLSNDD